MRVLAIETATAWGSVALLGPGGLLAERSAHVPGGHLEWLLPAIEEVLRAAGAAPEAVEGLVVSVGPGGFSGLRIGIATAAAWAHAAGRPMLGLSTLEILAAGVPGSGPVLSALDARRGEVAAALFRRDDTVTRLTPDLVAAPEALAGRLGALAEPITLAGDALESHAAALLESLAPWASAAPREHWWPRAAAAGALGRPRLLRGERHDPSAVAPIYARALEVREYAS